MSRPARPHTAAPENIWPLPDRERGKLWVIRGTLTEERISAGRAARHEAEYKPPSPKTVTVAVFDLPVPAAPPDLGADE